MAELIVLLPPMRHFQAWLAAGDLAVWLARGDRLPAIEDGRHALLRHLFEFTGKRTPVAALTRSLDARDAGAAQWLRADPCYVAADAVAVRMYACDFADLSDADAEALAGPLRPLFGDAGFPLEVANSRRWYLRCPLQAQLPAFADPDDVLGDDLMRHLPHGGDERRWRHLLNEAQVILHNHPLNAARAARGQLPVNSLWFWGGGVLPSWVRSTLTHVVGDDQLVVALAGQAGVPVQSLAESEIAHASDPGERLLIDLGSPGLDLDPDSWLPGINEALRGGAYASLHLMFASGEHIHARRRHRWRIWRRLPDR